MWVFLVLNTQTNTKNRQKFCHVTFIRTRFLRSKNWSKGTGIIASNPLKFEEKVPLWCQVTESNIDMQLPTHSGGSCRVDHLMALMTVAVVLRAKLRVHRSPYAGTPRPVSLWMTLGWKGAIMHNQLSSFTNIHRKHKYPQITNVYVYYICSCPGSWHIPAPAFWRSLLCCLLGFLRFHFAKVLPHILSQKTDIPPSSVLHKAKAYSCRRDGSGMKQG